VLHFDSVSYARDNRVLKTHVNVTCNKVRVGKHLSDEFPLQNASDIRPCPVHLIIVDLISDNVW